MAKLTAVEWLVQEMLKEISKKIEVEITPDGEKLIERAKVIEALQHYELFKAGQESMEEGGKSFDIYYKQTYGKADGS